MGLKASAPSKKYYWRIIQWTSAAVLAIIIVLSSVIYLNSQRILLEKENESNKKVFNQVKINIDMMDIMATNLCRSLYSESDVRVVMNATKEDIIDHTVRINRVVITAVSANPYIHSVSIYNNHLRRFFNGGDHLSFDDKQLLEMIDEGKKIPKLKAVSRKIDKLVSGKTISEFMFSYFLYEHNENTNEIDGAIAVNVRPDWFLKNIRQINMIDKERGEDVFVLDGNNEYIEVDQGDNQLKEWLKTEYGRYMEKASANGEVGSFESEFRGVNYLVTYSYIDSMDINILKVQKLSEVYRHINSLRTSVIIITLIFFGIAFIISTWISRRIYRPVGNLVQMISSDKNPIVENNGYSDEISYLNSYYKATMEKLDIYYEERNLNKDILKKYWINRLLQDSHTLDAKRAGAIFEEGRLNLSEKESFAVCLLKIDKYKAFVNEFDTQSRELLKFAVINISSEIIGGSYKNEGVDLKEDQVVLIIGIPENDEAYLNNISERIKEAQNHINEYFKISVSASISQKTRDIKELTSLYNKAIDNSTYRLTLGHGCIITPETIQAIESGNANSNIKELEVLMVEKIKTGDIAETEAAMKVIFKEVSILNYNQIIISLISMASAINHAIGSYKAMPGKHPHFDFGYICRCIMEIETLDEIYNVMLDKIRSILINEPDQQVQSKDGYIVEAVKEYIHKNYQNSGLSLTMISTVLNISTRRLSKAFKDETKMWVPDYINEVRLNKAAELLETTSLTVSEIVPRLGIDNETYFYGLFKKKFGLTPKEYAFKRIVNMSREQT